MKARVGHPQYGGLFASDTAGLLPFVLPGELVELAADTPARSAQSITILEPSAYRITPGCAHFGSCGGCHLQHADYPAQRELKVQVLRDIFSHAGLTNLPEIETHFAPEWGYRNRIRLRVEVNPPAPIRIGYSVRGSNDFLPIHMCPIATPLLWRAAQTLSNLASSDPLCRRWLTSVIEVELFCTPDQLRLQLQFFLRSSEPARTEPSAFSRFCERIHAALPELVGAGATLDPELNRRTRRNATLGRWEGANWGADGLAYPAAGRIYWVSRGAFFQVNPLLIDRLVRLVCGTHSGSLAWDLFAGVGLFTRPLASSFRHVVAVEGAQPAAADLLAASHGIKGNPAFEAVHSSSVDFLRTRQLQRERPDLIVLDPPRAGLGTEAASILTRIASPHLVYVSCDPTTLARDLAILTRDTYQIEALHFVDLFPQTFHIETVAHLRKR